MKRTILIGGAFVLAAASPALAHTGHGAVSGFTAGAQHPFLGLDHLLAMVTVGLWAAQYQAPRGWLLPAGFVGGMIAGAAAAFAGAQLPAVESAIALSVIALGAALSLRARVPLVAAGVLTFLAGLFHGHAHGLEATGEALSYIAGFVVATTILHGIGGGLGIALARLRYAAPVIGGLVALAGLSLAAG